MGTTTSSVGRVRRRQRISAGAEVARCARRKMTISQNLAHMVGGIDVVVLLFVVLPAPDRLGDRAAFLLGASAVLGTLGLVAGTLLGRRVAWARMGWLEAGREADPDERASLLRLPNKTFKINAGAWALAALGMFVLNAPVSLHLAFHVSTTILLGGVTTCGIAYLLMERDLRPVTDLALAAGPPARPAWPGVQGRVVLSWLLATGSPLLGIVLVGLDALGTDVDPERFGLSVVILAGLALVVGLGVLAAATRTVTRPLGAVRSALARVEGGDLSAELRIDDGSEVGLLQSGFNAMVGGLREREQLRGLYARQVGADVAEAALADEPVLGGETRDVAVLFVDLIGSTSLAQRTSPQRVVARLNAFFTVVVEVVGDHGGWVNKFEGDGALCVFGAPQAHPDAGGAALAAGRALRARIASDVPDLEAGIGVAAGQAVAGWVGARERFEYTVIGDPVNVASRLSDLAKRRPERLVAAAAIVHAAPGDEQRAWVATGPEVLRGRDEPTSLAVPSAADPAVVVR